MEQHLAALQYAQYHWSVIPVRAYEKRPLIKWQEFQQRCASVSEITEWYQRWTNANVGIVTGIISGIVVLDIDSAHGGDNSVLGWEQQHGPLPQTVEVKTGGGGRHLYFKHPGGLVHNKVGLAPGIDLRGDGGCVVAPPSMHPSGNTYVWLKGHEPGEIAIAELPTWLLKMVTGKGKSVGHSLSYWRQLVHQGVVEGERNSTIASLAGHLFWHGVDADVVQDLLLCWNRIRCQPPLDDDEVVQTVLSITHLHEREK
ncbi:bifunctional DNA primase/polymerase [Kaarinaea lacus]